MMIYDTIFKLPCLMSKVKIMKPEKELNYTVLPEIESRWSGRAFADQEMTKEEIESLVEAARWAPSSYNAQPWRFIASLRGEKGYDELFDTLLPGNSSWAGNAAALVLVLGQKKMSHNGMPNNYYAYDTGAAVAFLSLEAERKGLNIHQMGGFDRTKVNELFKFEEDLEPLCVLAIGKRDIPDALPEDLKARELAKQTRLSLSDILSFH